MSDSAQPEQPSPEQDRPQSSHIMANVSAATSETDLGERPIREKLKKASITPLPKYGTVEYDLATSSDHEEDTQREGGDGHDMEGMPTHSKKRSFDDLNAGKEDEAVNEAGTRLGHARKRSRDVEGGESLRMDEGEENIGQPTTSTAAGQAASGESVEATSDKSVSTPPEDLAGIGEGLKSPKKKRSRDQLDKDADEEEVTAENGAAVTAPSKDDTEIGDAAKAASRSVRDKPEKKRPRDTSQGPATETEEANTKVMYHPVNQPLR